MFERYDINDLFLASINVMYPEDGMWDVNVGGMLMMGTSGYGYLTILKKENNKYIDLSDMSRKITTTRDPKTTSYTIDYMEPFSKYYTQEGKKKETFSRRTALVYAKKYYNTMHQEHLVQLQKQQESKSL